MPPKLTKRLASTTPINIVSTLLIMMEQDNEEVKSPVIATNDEKDNGKLSAMNKREKKAEQKSLTHFFKSEKEKATVNNEIQSTKPKHQINIADTNQSELKIWMWNVNGIRAVLSSRKFEEFVTKGKIFSF